MVRPDAHRVVIVGGGFAGLHAARGLKDAPVHVTLVDRRNFHVFQPLLYQVATSGLSPADISSPIRHILRKNKNTQARLGEVVDFDLAKREVVLKDSAIGYDTLVVAAGSENNYFGNDRWAEHAPALKSMEDAEEIRRRVLTAFEAAEVETDGAARDAWLTFVIVGGGATGVELAGALAEIAKDTLEADFRSIDTKRARIHLVEGAERVLGAFPEDLSRKAHEALVNLGVNVRTDSLIQSIGPDRVVIQAGDQLEELPCKTAIWAAGVKPSPLARILAEQAGAPVDAVGRLIVDPHLNIPEHPEVFVLGDMAAFNHQGSGPLPGLAAVATQQGSYVAKVIAGRLAGRNGKPFRYVNMGTLATIGRGRAVADFGRLRISGYPAWLLWLFIHIMLLIGYENRALVLIQWAWNYFTRNRSTRLILRPHK